MVPKCGTYVKLCKNEGKICSELCVSDFFKGKKLLIIERRVKFIANVRKVSLS